MSLKKPKTTSKSKKNIATKKPLNRTSKAVSKKVKSAVKKQAVKVNKTSNKKALAPKKQLSIKKTKPTKKTINLKTKSNSVSIKKSNNKTKNKLTLNQNTKSKKTESKIKSENKTKVSFKEKTSKNSSRLNKENVSNKSEKLTNNASKVTTNTKKNPKEKIVKTNVKVVDLKQTSNIKKDITNKLLPKKQENKEIITKTKQISEPKGKFEIEFVLHSSTAILFEFLVSPSGLSEWFCDDVNIRNDVYTFLWDGSHQAAKLVKIVEEKLARFEWIEKSDGSYFEFRIEKDELTNDTSLIVTDFAENDEEKKSSQLLWSSQIDKLLHVLGSYN